MKYKPKIIEQRYILERKEENLIPVREDLVELNPGNCHSYTVLEYHNATACVACTSDQKIILLQIPRYPISEYLWEIPGGRIEPGESSRASALRELEEETGFKAETVEPLISFHPEPSFSTEKIEIFLATNLIETCAKPEREGYLRVKFFPFMEAVDMALKGKIKSSWSIIGILAAAGRLKLMKE